MEIRREETFAQNLEGRVGRHAMGYGDKGIPASKNCICKGAETGLVWEITVF